MNSLKVGMSTTLESNNKEQNSNRKNSPDSINKSPLTTDTDKKRIHWVIYI